METQTKKCPKCQIDIPLKAKICPNCKSDIRSWAARHPLILLVIAIPFFAGFMGFFNSDSQPTPTIKQPSQEIAYAVPQGIILKTLKSPSTAKFPSSGDIEDLGANRYNIRSYVDSQNGFGATIRSNWETVLKYKPGDPYETSSWIIEKVTFDGKVILESE